MVDMKIIPLNLADANRFVGQFHRHNKKVVGAKFSIGLERDGELVGVAIVGRPVARNADNGHTAEVVRVAVKDGVKNGSSMLYGRCKRICAAMGYEKVITYTLKTESGASMRAIGARKDAEVKPGEWSRKDRPRSSQKIYHQEKIRWEL